jgi:MFS family permease
MPFQTSFLVFLFVFEFGSLLCGVANSSTLLIVGRAVAGLGGSGLLNGGLTILNSCVPAHRQPGMCAEFAPFAQFSHPLTTLDESSARDFDGS